MARTTITPEVLPTGTPLTEEVLTWTNADVANGNAFQWTGKEILLVWNSDGVSARNVTVQSVAINGRQDPKHNIAQSIPFGEYRVYNFRGEGWKQPADGMVYVSGDNVAVRFIVLRLPA